jgi:peptidoglycan-N-acetylglucosamine deacetylase
VGLFNRRATQTQLMDRRPDAEDIPSRALCVSVDLDPLDAYYDIHGLGTAPSALSDHLSAVAIPRFREVFDRLGVRATFFAVGTDLASGHVAAALREAVAAGHEVGNHTHSHPYNFLDLRVSERAAEVARCHERILDATGTAPVGFRAPGYFMDGATLALLAQRGYRYDSSMLPSLPYYAAKLSVMGIMRLRGRRSRSRLHPPTCLLAPDRPYHPEGERPWRQSRSHGPMVELPAASLVAGVPLVGTLLGGLSPAANRLGARWIERRRFLSVEFHAIDLVGFADGGLEPLRGRQPGLEVPVARRLAAFEALLAPLCRAFDAVPLAEAARRFGHL